MIFDWLIGPLLSALTSLFSALPTGGLDLTGITVWTQATLDTYVQELHAFLPVDFLTEFVYLVIVVMMPAMLVYVLVQWAYKELPEIFGFGP